MSSTPPDDQKASAPRASNDDDATPLADAHDHRLPGESAAAARARAMLWARDVTVCVLSLDSELIAAIRHASGDQYAVSAAASWSELVIQIEAGQCGVALLDTAAMHKRIDKRIADLGRYAHRLVTLVAADRHEAEDLMGYLSDRKIHRLLIKPPAPGITRLLLESAVTRYLQMLHSPHAILDETGTHFAPLVARRRRPARRWAIGASVAVAAIVSVAAVAFWPRAPAPGSASVRAAAAQAPAQPPVERFADLTARAERAFAEGRLAEPSGDNALDYYLTILAAEPTHALAQARLEIITQALFSQAESALLDDAIERAETTLANIRRADPESARLAFLDAQLARARRDAGVDLGPAAQSDVAAANASGTAAAIDAASATDTASATAERAAALAAASATNATNATNAPTNSANTGRDEVPRAPAAAAPTELESLLAIARARIARKQWLEPQGDSAAHYVERARQIDAADPRTRAVSAELAAGLAALAQTSLRDGDLEAASRWLDEAQRLGAGPSLAKVLAQVDAAWSELVTEAQADARQALAARDWTAADSALAALERSGRAQTEAAALRRQLVTTRTQEQFLAAATPANELTLLSSELPEYPRDARQRGIEGWVELEYVVDRSGTPQGVTAVASEPVGRFDRAAIDAVSRYRYVPFELDGEIYERRVRVRMAFALK